MHGSKRDALVQHAALAFLERCPFGVIVIDRSMTIVEVNKQQEVNSGIGHSKFVGHRVDQLFAPVFERHGLAETMKRLVDEGQRFDIRVERFQRTFLQDEARVHWIGLQLAPDLFAIMTDGESTLQRTADPRIVGSAPGMDAVFTFIDRAARVNASVLVVGESGTGKELVARAIHARSDRVRHPFLALNCAALPGPLLESTLFGAERGAYTGADRRTKGYFEAAEGGVLMLDEIGDTSLEFQVKLMRVLEDGKVTRLGGTEPLRTNARVICATNRDLEKEVEAGRFRHDLFFRINVLRIELPPLRERADDIPLLVQHYLDALQAKHRLGRKHLTQAALGALVGYRWPGNVRELANTLEAAYVTTQDASIGLEHLPARIRNAQLHPAKDSFQPQPYKLALEGFRREYAARMLEYARGDLRRAARAAGVNPSTLYRNGSRSGLRRR
ncbi:MAG TPA: sigma-54 dependent transcriptional regulator [Myxococcales bacterium]|jgi:transcriptional regulator with PAS, ATPase and Fis domain|nr:sigma-54 dependent transcriptional regulator [Myxococcales bacterium]